MTTHCTHHSQCPECARIGHDRDGNNLAVYSDGSCWCFRCGYLVSASGIKKLQGTVVRPTREIVLPRDVDENLPTKAWSYLGNYELTPHDVLLNTILWSQDQQRLIFPYFDSTGLLGWQGRYLGDGSNGFAPKAKWFGRGKLEQMLHLIGNRQGRSCILTEDTISAIKVAHNPYICASPILGSHISTNRLLRLKLLFDTIYIWLDNDKQKEAVQFSRTAQLLGLNSSVIITDTDPKEHTDNQIKDILDGFTTT